MRSPALVSLWHNGAKIPAGRYVGIFSGKSEKQSEYALFVANYSCKTNRYANGFFGVENSYSTSGDFFHVFYFEVKEGFFMHPAIYLFQGKLSAKYLFIIPADILMKKL